MCVCVGGGGGGGGVRARIIVYNTVNVSANWCHCVFACVFVIVGVYVYTIICQYHRHCIYLLS